MKLWSFSFLIIGAFALAGCQVFPDIPAKPQGTDQEGGLGNSDSPENQEEPQSSQPDVVNLTPNDLSENLASFLASGVDPRSASGRVAKLRINLLRSEYNNANLIRVRRHGPFEETSEFTNSIEHLPKFNCDLPLGDIGFPDKPALQIVNDVVIDEQAIQLTLESPANLDGDSNFNGIDDPGENPLLSDRFYVYTFCIGRREANSVPITWELRTLSVLYTLDTYPSAVRQNPNNLSEGFFGAPQVQFGDCFGEQQRDFILKFTHSLRDRSVGPFEGLAAAGSSNVGLELRYFTTRNGDTSVRFNSPNENGPFGNLNTNGVGAVTKVNLTEEEASPALIAIRGGSEVSITFQTRPTDQNQPNTGELDFAGNQITGTHYRIGVELVIRDRAHDAVAILRDFASPLNVLFSSPITALNTRGRIAPPSLPSGRAIRAYKLDIPRCAPPAP